MSNAADRLYTALSGRYRIERELGAGGMATVYLAEDLKHDRKVAIKVLKPELAAVLGAERFVVEIKTTAAMSHPHILPLFDSGTADGFLFYVMPYIQGETIREKLNRETQFGVDEAVRIAREVADALDYAHRHGVIHRDIKPENILLHDGRAMVMDFGIALAVSAAAGGRMTETGLSLGTPHYMSPEQATAEKEITARSDQYSLASVLYEMLAGQPPHLGGPAQQVIMRIITEQARPVSEFRRNVPAHVVAAIARALEKLPADRFESAKAFADALGNVGFSHATTAGAPTPAGASRGVSATMYWATALIAVAAIGVATALWLTRPAAARPEGISRFEIVPKVGASVTAIRADRELAVSPDGSRIVYVGNDGSQLFMRSMDALDPVSLVGDQGTTRGPFFSPDGLWIAFFSASIDKRDAGQGLWKVSFTGGAPEPIVNVGGNRRGGSWGEDGTIVYATDDSSTGLWRVPADGGTPEQLTTPDQARGEVDHIFPSFLPGGKAVLYTITSTTGGAAAASVAVLDLSSGASRVLVRGGSDARYSASGHLVYGAGTTVRAVRFDLSRLETVGTPMTVLESVASRSGPTQFDVAANGTLVYVPERADSARAASRTLVWVDRQGRETPITAPAHEYAMIRLSPDGGRAAVEVRDGSDGIWLWNFSSQALTRFSFGSAREHTPAWTPDGRRILFGRGNTEVLWQSADGSGAPERLLFQSANVNSISADGRTLVVTSASFGGSLWTVSVDNGKVGEFKAAVAGNGLWRNGEISPDGRWLVYEGAPSGPPQIFVRPFPDLDRGLWQVTTEGGTKPVWARNGKELFFVSSTGAMMSVAVQGGATWIASPPVKIFDGAYYTGALGRTYDVSPDGRRFLMIKPGASETATSTVTSRQAEPGLVVVQRWDQELRRLVPEQ